MHTPFSRRQFLSASTLALIAPSISRALLKGESSRSMKIKNIERTTVKVPFRKVPARNMDREIPHWRYSEIVEVELQCGIKGQGETLLYYTWGQTSDADVKRAFGKNAVEIMWGDELGAGLQMALFNAVAKALDVPIHALLGKQVHQKTPVAWWNIDTSVEDMVSECQTALKQGYIAYKTKGRPWFDVWKQVEAVSKALPKHFKLAIDFNDTLLTAEQGIPILKDLAKYPQVAIYETPIFQSDIKGNQAIRKATRVPVAMHYGNPPAFTALKEEVCDGFVIGGGASRLMRRGNVAALGDKPFWLQLVGTGITAAWSLHFGGVLSHATWPAVNCHQLFVDELLNEKIQVKDGYAAVPDKPGLGYEINWDVVKKYKVDKPKGRPEPERMIETTWPDGRRMIIANNGRVNFMLSLGQKGKMPYFERGVNSRLLPDDGSEGWKKLYQRARKEPVFQKKR